MIRIWGSGGKIGKLGGCHLVMKMTGDRNGSLYSHFLHALSPLHYPSEKDTPGQQIYWCVLKGDSTSICADQPSWRECANVK